MLKITSRLCRFLLISNATLWPFIFLVYFIQSVSPIPSYLVKGNKLKELIFIETNKSYTEKLPKNVSVLSLNINLSIKNNYDELNEENNFSRNFRKLLSSELQPYSVMKKLSKTSSNKTNLKTYKMELEIENSRLQKQKKILNSFTNKGEVISGKENNASHIKQINNNNAHLPTFENYASSLNANNQSNTSLLLEDNSLTMDIFSNISSLLNDSSINMTTVNDFGNIPINPTKTLTNDHSTDNEGSGLTSAAVAGVVIAVLIAILLLTGIVIYILYQKCGRKSKLESKCPSDNCGYVDDTLRSSGYLNSHIELPKESSEEMTSLDNDSFLNSLESMTFQNYWADNTKNTKV